MNPTPIGIDVGKRDLVVAGIGRIKTYKNSPKGRLKLARDIEKKAPVNVVCEATGIYHLAIGLQLHDLDNVLLTIANPRAVHNFSKTLLTRGKSDPIDAEVLRQFAQRMPLQPWQPPSPQARKLRVLTRRITALVTERAAEKNRRHAAEDAPDTELILEDIEERLAAMDSRIKRLRQRGRAFVAKYADLQVRYELLVSIPGVGEASGLTLLGELSTLPLDMSVRQWVAHAGLDPIPDRSGLRTGRERLSRRGNVHLRRALFLPALTALQRDPSVKAFFEHLVERKQKAKMVAIGAIMRKLLHAIFGMFRTETVFDGAKCFRAGRKSTTPP